MASILFYGTIFPSPYDSQSLPMSVKMHRRIFGRTNGMESSVGIQFLTNAALDNNELVFGSRTICSESACQKAPKNVGVAVQNCHKVASGAYTGEIRVMKNDFRQQQGLFSRRLERRNVFVEKDEVIAEQVTECSLAEALAEGCVCEHLEDREAEKTSDVVFRQVKYIADKVSDWSKVVIAYEPVWAIGTGKTASAEQAQEVHEQLRQWLKDNVSDDVAASTRIIYGGSVTRELANETDVDVFLVGVL